MTDSTIAERLRAVKADTSGHVVVWVENLQAYITEGTFSHSREWRVIFREEFDKLLAAAGEAADYIDQLRKERDEALALVERVKIEAQGHAMEARGANATIYEIYQVLSGGKGEPGNWHGAGPARQFVASAEAALAAEREARERAERNRDMWKDQCDRQAIELEAARRFGGGFFADVVLERTRDHYRKEVARSRSMEGKDG